MGDRAALATAMRQLADDPTRRHRLTDAGIASLADYRPHVVAERLAGLYQGAVSTKTATTKATDR
jgi:glycosyltransferase involved in cell wall biosynthesis